MSDIYKIVIYPCENQDRVLSRILSKTRSFGDRLINYEEANSCKNPTSFLLYGRNPWCSTCHTYIHLTFQKERRKDIIEKKISKKK